MNTQKQNTDYGSESYKKARFHYLLQIIFGESLAINYCKTIATFAPSAEARDFLLQQQIEEETHLELLTEYVAHIDRPHVPISSNMRRLHAVMDKVLEDKDYAKSVFVQNFIVEGLVITLLEEMSRHGDEGLKSLCDKIISDEVRHVQFGVDELKSILSQNDKRIYSELIAIQRRTLLPSILLFFNLAVDARKLGIDWDVLAAKTIEKHTGHIRAADFHLPLLDRMFLTICVWVLKIL